MRYQKILISLTIFFSLLLISSTQIIQVNSQFFSSQIQPNDQVWIILTTQQSSNSKIQILQKLSQIFKGLFKFGTRQSEQNKFSQGDLHLYADDKQSPIEYTGDFTLQSVVDFVLFSFDNLVAQRSKVAKQLKDHQEFQRKESERAEKQWKDQQELRKKSNVLLLNHQNWDTFIKGREAFLINFYEANCSACIDLNKQWQSVATQMKGQIRIAKINITEQGNQKLQDQLQISKYPSIRFYPTGNKNVQDFSQYEGIYKKFSIKQWVNIKINQKVQKAHIPDLNKQNYETLCKNTKATCIIFFLENRQQDVMSKIQALQLKHLSKPISFMIAQKGSQSSFEKQVEVNSYPDVVMMFDKRKQMWHEGGMNLDSVDQTINEISLGNRLGFNKYKFDEQII